MIKLALAAARHRWADPVRHDHHTAYRACVRCGLCKVSRHEGPVHWCEFERPDGARIVVSDNTTPACEAA